MKNNFDELNKKVAAMNNIHANKIIELLEEYNNGLSHHFKNRSISREFLKIFDHDLTLKSIGKKFDVDVASNMQLQQLALDLNLMARSTWYFEKENGDILTGEDLYHAKAVFIASTKQKEEVYLSKEDKKRAKALEDIFQSPMYAGQLDYLKDLDMVPKPTHIEETVKNNMEYKEPESVDDMFNLITFYTVTLPHSL